VSVIQIGALAFLAVSLWWAYAPKIQLPAFTKKPDVMRHIQAVIEIRDQAKSPEVTQACQALLQALLR
jgi:hypothetical protein